VNLFAYRWLNQISVGFLLVFVRVMTQSASSFSFRIASMILSLFQAPVSSLRESPQECSLSDASGAALNVRKFPFPELTR
jgi:hypothetical protein